jgi:hypothetical protein
MADTRHRIELAMSPPRCSLLDVILIRRWNWHMVRIMLGGTLGHS